jgi:hypothetical protein
MKKFLLTFIITCALVNAQAQDGLRPRGDVNCDWEVNIADINTLLDSIFSGAKYNSFYSYATDINGDREINIADLNLLIDAILGKILPDMPSFSGTLPVLYINTEGYRNIDSKEEYIHADWWLDNMGLEGYESLGSKEEPLGMQIKGRGNYTWIQFKEKPFRIKLDTKQRLLGMKRDRHFCLLPYADDQHAKLNNTMGFELSCRIGLSYTPDQAPVEVVLNGQYIGLYFLTEKIRVCTNRVNIEEQCDGETDPANITGGWLLEIDNYEEDNTIIFNEREGNSWDNLIRFTPHYPENLSEQQIQYITQFLLQANKAIYTPDKSSTEWEKYIDIDSLACFYIVAEITDNIEAFSGSCFMHKHKGDSTKLIFGPVWDLGSSFKRLKLSDATSFDYFIYQGDCFQAHWIKEIAKFPHFQEVVRRYWKEFYDSGFNGLDIDQFIDDHVSTIRQAWFCHAQRWRRWSSYDIDKSAALYKTYICGKIDWLQSQWGSDYIH